MRHTVILIVLALATVPADGRTWTSKQGRTIEADFVKVDGETVHLQRTDGGRILKIKLDQLSEADVEFVAYASLDFPAIRAGIVDQIDRLTRGTYQSQSDRDTAVELLRIYKEWLDGYDDNPDDPIPSYMKLRERTLELFQRKPIIAYKYNELLGSEVEVPVQFNLFTDSDSFYFRVGDGDFSTIAPVSIKQLAALQEAIGKIQTWKETCRAEQMDTRKEVGQFGGVRLVFVSKEKGDNIFVWMTARGPWGRDRMVEEQTVRLTPLNISAMFCHIGRAKELYDTREEERRNAEKLN